MLLICLTICLTRIWTTAALDLNKYCMDQSTNEKNPVIWASSPKSDQKVLSNPICLTETRELVTRVCAASGWIPQHDEVPDCFATQSQAPEQQCPPGYSSITNLKGSIQFCYLLTPSQSWDYPCIDSGSTETIFDLNSRDLGLLLSKLTFTDKKLVWLPANRIVPFGPIVWSLPGEDWGDALDFDYEIKISRLPIVQNCLLADLDNLNVRTDNCTYKFPYLCIAKPKHLLPLHCPKGYYATRYGHNNGRCYGLEIDKHGQTWQQFLDGRCPHPLQISNQIENHIFRELTDHYDYDFDDLCWTALIQRNNTTDKFLWYPDINVSYVNWDTQTNFNFDVDRKGTINEKYRWLLSDKDEKLSCMACQTQPANIEVDISLQIVPDSDSIYLIVYYPKGLWRDDDDDIGVRCFTNARGFVKSIHVEGTPFRRVNYRFVNANSRSDKPGISCEVEKVVHEIKRVGDESAEYWCEGHNSKNFSLIKTPKLLLPSKHSDEHIYVLKLLKYRLCLDRNVCNPNWRDHTELIKKVLTARSVRVMAVSYIDADGTAEIVFHVTVKLIYVQNCDRPYYWDCGVVKTFHTLNDICKTILPLANYKLVSLKSTVYCLPIENDDEFSLHWELTVIGDNTAPQEFCMQSNGLPVSRKCGGSFLYGGKWDGVVGTCSENFEPTNRTTFLYTLSKGRSDMETTSSFLTHGLISLLNDKNDLIPADVYFLAMSLKLIVEISNTNSTLIELGDTSNIATAIDSIMHIEEDYLSLAQTLNSSNVLLESIDLILSKIASNNTNSPAVRYHGLDIAITPQFVIQISDPSINNITGLALVNRHGNISTSFADLDVISLTANMTIFDVLAIEGLEIATWMTQDLFDSLNRTNSTQEPNTPPKVIINAFYSDVVFQETKEVKDVVNSRIISLTVPGYESDLVLPLPLVYRRLDRNDSAIRACAYWDFNGNQHSLGQWAKVGCYRLASNEELDVCGCFHLTHFAQLVLGYRGSGDNNTDVIIRDRHGRALNTITVIGCSLSLVGVAGILITAGLFRSWRKKPGTKVLLQLSVAIALQSIMIIFQDTVNDDDFQCVAMGSLLHYAVLAAFMWMLLTALLQFARYVRVLGAQRPVRFMVKFSLAGWGIPIIPVAILLFVDYTAYLPLAPPHMKRDPGALCYPQGLALYLTILLPVACIVVTNLIVFVLVMRSILRGPDGKLRPVDPELALSQLRLSVLLFFLLGLSWIFGFLAVSGGRILFSYLFCLTASLQGFVLFLYFVVCDPATRVLWVSLVRERSSVSTKSKSTSG